MNYKLIADSSCDVPGLYNNKEGVTLIPFKMTIDGTTYVDDATMDQTKFLAHMKQSKNAPATACPSPADYADAMSGDEDAFVVTISSPLSGSYQCAKAAIDIKTGKGRVHVFDSMSAGPGEYFAVLKIKEYIAQGMSFLEIVEKTESFLATMKTFFVLQSLDNLIKNGRMGRVVGGIATMLHMRPIMSADMGKITLAEKARGTDNAINRMIEMMLERAESLKKSLIPCDTLVVSHCNCPDRAAYIRQQLLKRSKIIKNVIIVATNGLTTCYANDGGIIIAY